MGEYQAIQTPYKGYLFRSRLEARWAVFFDAMGIRYLYENEGFEIHINEHDIIRYLPDFYLPDYGLYAEVKGADCLGQIPKEEAEKISWMVDYDGPCSNGIILLGNLPDPIDAWTMDWAVIKWNGEGIRFGYSMGETPTGEGLWDGINCVSAPFYFRENNDLTLTGAYHFGEYNLHGKQKSKVELALTKARQARFEHGETPTT